jgi:hypothetical protein
MIPFACAGDHFLHSWDPAAVPLRACCAAAIIRTFSAPSSELSSAPFVCAAERLVIPHPAATAELDS